MWALTKEELEKIIENHQHWINEDCDGWEGMRAILYEADLSRANLHGTNLSRADLSRANLYKADLGRANLSRADLSRANLYKADLSRANLYGADLRGANLSRADLRGANLSGADLYKSDLSGANLYKADLSRADLYKSDLSGANLYKTDLSRADLYGADFSGKDLGRAKNVPFIPTVCPDTGSFTGWKKGLGLSGYVIIGLDIPADAKRSSATTRKCRCSRAVVKSITSIDGSESFDMAFSKFDRRFIYKVGETVSVDNFDEDRFNECSTGIHFFINRQEAVDYVI